MVLDAVSNFVRGNTDASVDSTQTTVSVDDASIFPDPASDGEYNVVIWDVASHPRPDQDPAVEILRVTAIDTTNDDLTVTRGQETTSGASHPSGSAIHLSPTAKMFGDIESTFAEFYDDANQELTADVNNGSVSTDELPNKPNAPDGLSTTEITNEGYSQGINITTVTIPDDDVASVDSSAYATIFVNSASQGSGAGQFTAGFDDIETIFNKNIDNQGNIQLTGTDGTDGKINVSVDNNILYIENRTGATEVVIVVQFGIE